MNMTQEEVTKRLKALKARCERLIVSSSAGNPEEWRKDAEAIDMAITALRPVSREQVEKVWIGCNNCRTCDSCAYRYTKAEEEPCWSCNTNIYSNYKPEPNRKFCPACGAPMTDEAVDMVMERLEALRDE